MELSALEEVGLSPAEVKIYSALIELGPSKAGAILRYTGLQNSVVHLCLGQLVKKGVVAFIKRGAIKIYEAADPRSFLRLLDERRNRVTPAVEYLLSRQHSPTAQEAEIYEGMQGLKAMCYRFIEDVEPGDDYLFFAFSCPNEENEQLVYEFYREYTDIRQRRGLKLKGISNEKLRSKFESLNWPHTNILYVNFPTLQSMSICRDKVIFTPWDDRQISFLICSTQLANNLRAYFYSVWDKGVR